MFTFHCKHVYYVPNGSTDVLSIRNIIIMFVVEIHCIPNGYIVHLYNKYVYNCILYYGMYPILVNIDQDKKK